MAFSRGGLLISLICCYSFMSSGIQQIGRVSVTNLVLSEQIDVRNQRAINPTIRFHSTAKMIIVSFNLQISDKVPVIIVLYSETEPPLSIRIVPEQEWIATSIIPKNEEFVVGKQKVEIRLGQSDGLLLAEKDFEIYR